MGNISHTPLSIHDIDAFAFPNSRVKPYYSYETSGNPAIHNVNNVLRHKIIHASSALPPIPHSIAGPFKRATRLESISNEVRSNLIKVADVKIGTLAFSVSPLLRYFLRDINLNLVHFSSDETQKDFESGFSRSRHHQRFYSTTTIDSS